MAIINSFLNQDLYKYTMAQCVFHQFSKQRPITRFVFKCRNANELSKHVDEINSELDHLCTLKHTSDELDYLSTIPFFSQDFIDFLEMLQLKREYIECWVDESGEFRIEANGPWMQVIWFEVFVLAIVQEVYTSNTYPDFDLTEARNRLSSKIEEAKQYGNMVRFTIADFGTRRRFSHDWHREVVATLTKELPRTTFVGTSNVLFAKEFNLKPIGTMAHEIFMGCMGMDVRLSDSQRFTLDTWVKEYRGELGIALSDVVGFDAFLRDFDKYFAKLYDGCRHDSGDPFQWGEKLIAHYQKLGIDPLTKSAVFSDGLTFDIAFKLAERFRGRIKTSFGIGTNLTNDVGITPMQVVMKMVECNGNPVAKISDSSGKGMCEDPEFLSYLKKVFKIEDVLTETGKE